MNHSLKISLLISSLILVVLLAGCGSSKDIHSAPFDLNRSSVSNIPYSISSSRSFAFSKAAIEKQLGKSDISRSMKNYSYEIRNVSDGSKIINIYNENRYVSDTWRLTHLLNLELFKDIKSGESSVNDVKKIDPYFLIPENSPKQEEAESEHRLDDNGALIIKYKKNKNDWIVDSIEHIEQDPSGFKSKLLPEDVKILMP